MTGSSTTGTTPRGLPFLAPCRKLEPHAPYRWLRKGWNDVRHGWRPTLSYGLTLVAASWLVTALAFRLGSYVLVFAALTGFVFIAPVAAIGLYEVSRQAAAGRKPMMIVTLRGIRRVFGNAMVFSLALLVVFLVWARSVSLISVFMPMDADPTFGEMWPYLLAGTMVGALFSAVTFAVSAFSLPMIEDRETDTITAVVTSVNAVLRNKRAMANWAAVIVTAVLIGFATGFLMFIVMIPLLGYATWHGYLETIDASAWPKAGQESKR
ncbi:MAG: DUF2189 domain-containing protein [Gammaproteobacteria bacterium]|nr:DUF2189 domain-containing protein [Gammaproteobacteria bacterium]